MRSFTLLSVFLVALLFGHPGRTHGTEDSVRFVQVRASDKYERSALADIGMNIEAVRSDSVWGFATLEEIKEIHRAGHEVLAIFDRATGRGGHDAGFG